MGKCPECGQWDSFVEEAVVSTNKTSPLRGLAGSVKPKPVPIDEVVVEDQDRLSTQIAELDRVLGGGLVEGSLVLIGGDPGIVEPGFDLNHAEPGDPGLSHRSRRRVPKQRRSCLGAGAFYQQGAERGGCGRL